MLTKFVDDSVWLQESEFKMMQKLEQQIYQTK